MRYRFDDIATFIHVVETGSLTAAAKRLNVSKSVVSERITHLEQSLGIELLRRSARRVLPTEKGTAFYERARAILQQLEEATVEVSDAADSELAGSLCLSAPMSFGTMHLGGILLDFAAAHPRLDIALELDDRFVDLNSKGFDLAVRIGSLDDSSLVARRLAVSRRIVCCSPDYARRVGLPANLDELTQHACIGYTNRSARDLWRFEPSGSKGAPRAVAMRGRITANNGEVMRDAAIAGLGLALLPLFIVADALRAGTLIDALPSERPVPDTIHAVYPKTRHVPRKVRALVDHLVAAFAGRLPWEAESVAPAQRARIQRGGSTRIT
jgi:DNA-binding transcriptional LysR family regulator